MEGEDLELWDIIEKIAKIPILIDNKGITVGPKPREKYYEENAKRVQKNAKDKKILLSGIGSDEYNRSPYAEMQNPYGMFLCVHMRVCST